MPRAYFNPFYLLSVLIGIAFLITATAYGVMAFRGATPHLLQEAEDTSSVMVFLSKYGALLFMVELAALMLTTIAAIATDEFWAKGSAESAEAESAKEEQSNDAEKSAKEEQPAEESDSNAELDSPMEPSES